MLAVKEASKLEPTSLKSFFGKEWDTMTDHEELYQYGHFVEQNEDKKGFFALIPIDQTKTQFWLRSLYLKKGVRPQFVMTLIESVRAYAEEKGFEAVIAFSHDSSTETLLSAHQFQQIAEQYVPSEVKKRMTSEGTWWAFSNK